MKRSAMHIFCICMFLAMVAGTVWAEWEGNAGIASAGEFPLSGMYARSDMFPKNTVVEIRNLETEITVRAIITGTSGVPGLVAILSPLTASALQIRTGSVSRVRISVPSPVSERPAPGTVATGSGLKTADPDVNPAAAAKAANPAVAAAPVAAPVAAQALPLSSLAQASADPLVPLAEPVTPSATLDPPVSPEVPAAVAFFAAEPAVPETPPAPVTRVDEVTPDPIESAPVVSTIFFDEPDLESAVVEEQPFPEPDIVVMATIPPSGDFAAALVPAEVNPPPAPELPAAAPVVAVVPAVPALAAIPAPVSVPTVVPAAPVAVAPVRKPVNLPIITAFAPSAYYVQIASYSDPVNAEMIVDSYGKKYPVAVERSSLKGVDVLKVFIGPVKKDEYGAVLERFKTLGFKDAFVRKGQ